jgi:hypothetical protein
LGLALNIFIVYFLSRINEVVDIVLQGLYRENKKSHGYENHKENSATGSQGNKQKNPVFDVR